MCDGVFDEECSEVSSELKVASREYENENERLEKLAFREGYLMAKDESLQKGFDSGFAESFTNYSAIGKLKGLTIALLMGLPEDTDESLRQKGESIWCTLEDLEILLCDPEKVVSTGIAAIGRTFEDCKASLKEVCNSTNSSAGTSTSPCCTELLKAIDECNINLSQSSINRVTTNSPLKEEEVERVNLDMNAEQCK